MSPRNHNLADLLICTLLGLCLLITASMGQAMERVTFYHNDALGSPVAATNATGTLLWRESYAPYGKRLTREAGSRDTVWYTGKPEEATFGLSYFGARWYDPAIGRFLAMDPAGFDPDNIHSFGRYGYANDNPYRFIDPDGFESLTPEQEIMQDRAQAFGKIRAVINPVGEVGQAALEFATPALGLVGSIRKSSGLVNTLRKESSLWSSTKNKSAVENALQHWNKHKSDFPELKNSKQYVESAKDFLTKPPKGTMTKTNSRGDTLRYNPNTNTFGVLSKDGAPRTMFRPKNGMEYWNRQ